MVSPRRARRLGSLIKARVAEILMREINDPRLGLVTVTGVDLDRELAVCRVYWSVLGGAKERRRNAQALDHARRFIQREVAEVLPTRTVPELRFEFDESIEGSIRVQRLIEEAAGNGPEASPEAAEGLEPPETDPKPGPDDG